MKHKPLEKLCTSTFVTSAWQQHMELVTHLCQFSQNVLLILAPSQGGKTVFADHLLKVKTTGLVKIAIKAESQLTTEALLKKVVHAFNLNWEGLAKATKQVQGCVEKHFQQAQTTYALIVDDAHLLTPEQLQSLLQLIKYEAEPRKQLHLILLGEAALELTLFSADFTPYVNGKIYTIELESWTLPDLQHFFTRDDVLPRLTAPQIGAIFERTRGLPGAVVRERNALLKQLTTTGKIMATRNLKQLSLHPVSLGMVVGIMLGGAYLLFNGTLEEEGGIIPVNAAQFAENNKETEDVVAFQFDKEEQPSLNTQEKIPEAVTLAQETLPVMPAAPAVELNTASVPVSVSAPATAPKIIKSRRIKENSLLAANSKHYTLQLLGARKEENVKHFIQQHALQDKANYFRTQLSGKDWYVVIYGEYPSQQEAKAALKRMPSSLKSAGLQPWVRDMQSVQQDVRQSTANG